MSLTPDDVKAIARLARLAIAEQDIPAYAKNLSSILEFVAQLEKADTASVQPMAHPLVGLTQPMRADTAVAQVDRDRYQQNAPQVEAGLYLVPKVVE
ncbi:MAG TPA: Asp-tRNA(Asn)/Glu-tRNA(Gln) amidotransferase subunit GatC [Gammaproteobacteria bacterium]|jgi:aspartyl-tRNA(Asn)/glutamyl-tRNA(Gln) amidotransferase subunit C|nr:Asp-tRNA(Asn)/Glu-tRNA(Gln) amidotransferase subunit GatC [Gammaproteobacteria bacterium]